MPTDEQLVNFAAVLVHGPGAPQSVKDLIARAFTVSPWIKDQWLERHREFQAHADALGAAEAEASGKNRKESRDA